MRSIFLVFSAVFLGACSIWGLFDGKFSRSSWQIEKIVVEGKEYLSPQILKAEAIGSQTQDAQVSRDLDNTALPADSQDKTSFQNPSENDMSNLQAVSTMEFDQVQHRIYGIASCNNYFASYTWKDNKHIEISSTGITRKLCNPDELMSFEFQMMRHFEGVFKLTKEKNSMILDNGKIKIYLE